MASFVLKLGSIDLADYCRVSPGEGLDPYGQAWEEPQFSQSAVGEGNGFIGLDVKNREMAWPLFLKDTSKDNLQSLKQRIVREARYGAKPLRVEWRDDGATTSTFYDIAWARLDEKFNFRLSQQEWADAGLRVWLQPPYGHTATERIVGTAVSTGLPVVMVPLASVVGDAPALTKLRLTNAATGSVNLQTEKAIVGAAVVPSGWPVFIPAASLVNDLVGGVFGTATIVGDPRAPGSQSLRWYVNQTGSQDGFVLNIRPSQIYSDARVRFFGLFTSGTNNPTAVAHFGMNAARYFGGGWEGGPGVQQLPSSAFSNIRNTFRTVEFGTWEHDGSGTQQLQCYTGFATAGAFTPPTTVSSQAIQLAGLMVLPEDTTFLARVFGGKRNTAGDLVVATQTIDGTNRTVVQRVHTQATAGATLVAAHTDVTDQSIGEFPTVQPGSQGYFQLAMMWLPVDPDFVSFRSTGGSWQGASLSAEVRVRERFTFAR